MPFIVKRHRENRVWQHNPLLSLWPGQLGKAQTDMEVSNFTPTLCYKSRIVVPLSGLRKIYPRKSFKATTRFVI